MNLRSLHALSATVVAAFAALHLINHLVGLAGVAEHLAFMRAARQLYRAPPIEILLLACVALQVASGLVLGWRARRGGRDAVARLQLGAGLVLSAFLAVHVGAVLFARWQFGLDTNFHFAAAGMHVPPLAWFFAPYYTLGVAALFVHLGCAMRRRLAPAAPRHADAALASMAIAGMACALLIVAALAGLVHPVRVPPAYLATFGIHP